MISRDPMLGMLCGICGTQVRVRSFNPVTALHLAMANGWGLIHHAPPMAACPFHNPARIEFGKMELPYAETKRNVRGTRSKKVSARRSRHANR